MARRFTLQIIMDLASRIGANPSKAISRSNISFLGKGPTKNPLFQERLAGLENATEANLGKPETLFAAIDDAVGWAKDGKLNSIQQEILGHNLSGINKILNPPVLPSASITPIASGIEGLRRFPKETHKFMGRPLKDKDFSEIDRMIMEGKIPDARGRTWNLKAPETGTERYNRLTGLDKSKPFQGWKPSVVPKANIPASKINHQIIADKYGIDVELIKGKDWVEVLEVIRKLGLKHGGLAGILQAPKMKHGGRIGFAEGEDWKSKIGSFFSNLGWGSTGEDLRRGKEQFKARNLTEGDEHLRYFKAMGLPHSDNFLKDLAESWAIATTSRDKEEIWNKYKRWLEMENFERANIAKGGLAEILQAPRSGYSKGRLVRGALAILNKNKKNADYMFKASDNVSPGYAAGDIKYNAELLADQLAEDAGVLYADLGALEQTKFYGTAYDYLAKEMGQVLSQKRMMKKLLSEVDESMTRQALYQWKPGKGRKPSASGGLAGILEV